MSAAPGAAAASVMTLGFTHRYLPAPVPAQAVTLLLLHAAGGDEGDLIPLGKLLASDANLLSPRGWSSSNGMTSFFRLSPAGLLDLDDLWPRAQELADFVENAAAAYGLDRDRVAVVGYSGGATMGVVLLLSRPALLAGAILLRAKVPYVPVLLPDLSHVPVFLGAGRSDPAVTPQETERLASLLRSAGSDVTTEYQAHGHTLTGGDEMTARSWLESDRVPAAIRSESLVTVNWR